MKNHDLIQRFLFEEDPIRGQLVSLNHSWQQILDRVDAEDYAKIILGHALTAVTLLASTLKFDGNITLQIRGSGALNLLVAQATSKQTLRGIVKQSAPIEDDNADLADIFQADKIVITIDSGKGLPYQGIVPLNGKNLSDALVTYFEQSEQLQTHLWLACDKQGAAGLLLQKLPGEMHDEDAWERAIQLAQTITDKELLELTSDELLYRLFHEEKVRVFKGDPLSFHCGCSRERSLGMLKSLGKDELNDILRDEGRIEVSCDFCNAHYHFDSVDVEHLFNATPEINISSTRH